VPETFDVGEQAESEGVWTGYHRIEDESQLNADQRRYLRFARVLARELGIERDVYYGEASADAWTDGRTYIVITDSAVTSRQRAVWMHDLYLVMLHEAAHETSSRDRPFMGITSRVRIGRSWRIQIIEIHSRSLSSRSSTRIRVRVQRIWGGAL